MDKNKYKSLDSDQKRTIWQRLESNPDFQLLRDLFYEQTRVTAQPDSVDGREAFYSQSIRANAIRDVLDFPFEQLRQRAKYQTDKPENTFE